MSTILDMDKNELLKLSDDIKLNRQEDLYLFRKLNAFWIYEKTTTQTRKPEYHVKREINGKIIHSNGFLKTKNVLKHPNLCRLIARNLYIEHAALIDEIKPDYVAGIPCGATELGKYFAEFAGIEVAKLIKNGGNFELKTKVEDGKKIICVEDWHRRYTTFTKVILQLRESHPKIQVCPQEFVIINRGDPHNTFCIQESGKRLWVCALIKEEVFDYPENDCPLCRSGSKAIDPNLSDENLQILCSSRP